MTTTDLDLSELPAFLEHTVREIEAINFTPANQAACVLMRNHLVEGMKKGVSPDGTPFAPLKRPRRDRRGKIKANQAPLWDTGRLASSLGAGPGHVEQVGRFGFVLGTNVAYAGYQNEGTKHIPARPFVGLSDAALQEIDDLYGDFVERALGG